MTHQTQELEKQAEVIKKLEAAFAESASLIAAKDLLIIDAQQRTEEWQ